MATSETTAASSPRATPTATLTRYVHALILSLLFAWLVVSVIHDFRLIVRSYTPLPFWDAWVTIAHYLAYRHLDLPAILIQHNEHRIVFPELIFMLDALLFRDRQALPIVLSCFFYIGIWALLARSLVNTPSGNSFAKLCALLAAGIVMAWSGSTLVLASPFQIVWPLLFFSVAGALVFLSKLAESGRPRYCAWAVICAVIATFTVANGLLIWPVLILLATLLRLRKSYVWTIAITAAASIALFFTHYRFAPSNFGFILRHPFSFLKFAVAYLGVPFSPLSDSAAISAGLVSVAGFICFAWIARRRNLVRTRAGIVLFGFQMTILLSAFMTALGRIDTNNPSSITSAIAHRYIVVPLLGWAALVMIAGWLLSGSRSQRAAKRRLDLIVGKLSGAARALPAVSGGLWAAPLAVLLVALTLENRSPKIKTWLQNPRYTFFSSPQIASLCFESGLDDSGVIQTVLPVVWELRRLLPIAKQYKLTVFSRGRIEWIGKPARSIFSSISRRPEAGAITVVHPIESGLELVGWSESPRSIFRPEQLVFLNEEQRIIGFGSKLPENLPPGYANLKTPSALAWVGFANLTIPSQSVSAYRIDKSGRSLLPVGRPLSLDKAGPQQHP